MLSHVNKVHALERQAPHKKNECESSSLNALHAASAEIEEKLKQILADHPKVVAYLEKTPKFSELARYIHVHSNLHLLDKLKLKLKMYGDAGFIEFVQQQGSIFTQADVWELLYEVQSENLILYPIYKLKPDARYFISVCNTDLHHFFLSGCYPEADDSSQALIFSAAGKYYDSRLAPANRFLRFLKAVFSKLFAFFKNEKLIPTYTQLKNLSPPSLKVSYRAYELNFQQYEKHVQLLKQVPSLKPLTYYVIYSPEDANGCVNARYAMAAQDVRVLSLNGVIQLQTEGATWDAAALKAYQELSLQNNCRHSALAVLQQAGVPTSEFPAVWGGLLPQKAVLSAGKVITPLFVLPIPPELSLKTSNGFLYRSLKDLHENIVRLSLSNYGLELASRKLDALKALYQQLLATKAYADPGLVSEVICAWKTQSVDGVTANLNLIKKPRGEYFKWSLFSNKQTASSLIIEKIEKNSLCVRLAR